MAESPLPGIGAAVGAQLLQLVGELADQLPEDAQRQLAEGLAVVRSRPTG